MAYEVTVSNDQFPEGHEFEVVGLGLFKNGEAREVTEDQEKQFVSLYGMSVADRVGEQDSVQISGSPIVENIDDVLGVDVSDRPEPPDLEAITAAHQEEMARQEEADKEVAEKPNTIQQQTTTAPTTTVPNTATTTTGGDT